MGLLQIPNVRSALLGQLHDLLDPVHVDRHTDEDVGLPRVTAATHGDDDALQDPAVAVLTGQRSAIIPLKDRHHTLHTMQTLPNRQ